MKKENGITLIALVITIIVLLILAGVSLKLIAGGNGIIGKAEKAVDVTNETAEKEIIQLAYITVKVDYWKNGEQVTKEKLKQEIENSNKKVEVENCDLTGASIEDESQYARITFEDTKNWYIVDLTTGEIIVNGKNGKFVPAPMDTDLEYTIIWNGTNATVTFTTSKEFTIQTSINGTDWEDTNSITVSSATQIYVRYSDGENQGIKYEAIKPLWTGTVTYDANGGSGDIPNAKQFEHTRTVEIDFSKKPTKDGEVFLGWAKNKNAETPDYSENGTKQFTMETENITLYAVWGKSIDADEVAKNPAMYYGKTVNYTPPNKATSEWQIFYADTENIYLVTKSCVAISYMPSGKEGTKLTASTTTTAALNSVTSDYAGTSDITTSNPAKKWLSTFLNHYSSTDNPWKATAYLIDTSAFSVFADSTLVEYAIGAPTLELFVKSYNVLNADFPTSFSTTKYGYSYAKNLTPSTSTSSASGGHMTNIQSCGGLYNATAWFIAGGQYQGRF